MDSYVQLVLVGLLPVLVSAGLYILEKKTPFGRISYMKRQIIYGLIFGGLAIIGTEFGVPMNGVTVNARDAAPLCAGLIFGAPSGIIAGLIGGVERWFAAYWGAGTVTQLACSLSTIIAGLFGAALRKWMFDNKKPVAWYFGFAAGAIMEVLHMTMIFLTNMGEVKQGFFIIEFAALPMIIANACSVMLALLVVGLIGRGKKTQKKKPPQIAQTFSRWLFIAVLIIAGATFIFTYLLETELSLTNTENLFKLNIADVKEDIEATSNENLLYLTETIAEEIHHHRTIDSDLLKQIKSDYGDTFSVLSYIDPTGIITASTDDSYVGYDMASGEQSSEFLILNQGAKEYVQPYQPQAKDGMKMKYAGSSLRRGGFIQIGYDAKLFQKEIAVNIEDAVNHRHIGESGFLLVVGTDQVIASTSRDNLGRHLINTGIVISADMVPGEFYRTNIYGKDSFWTFEETEGYYIIAAQPVEETFLTRDLSVMVMMFLEAIVFAILFFMVYFLIRRIVVRNILKINRTLAEITSGNLNAYVDVRSNEEFISLSDDINATVDTLKTYIDEAAARIDQELEVAKVIQFSTLPNIFPPYPDKTDFDIYATMDTAREVGGDFYDFYLLDENRFAFLVADVSGKGITAAMFMMKAKTLLKDLLEKETDAAEIIAKANNALCEGNEAEMFVTCWMGILDLSTHTITFANAGHNPPLLRRKGGSYEYLRTRPGLVLGGMEGMIYRTEEITFFPGDELFLYTDGVTEATDMNEELYGDDRLQNILNAQQNKTAEEICRAVKTDVDAFVGEAPQFDDMTMLSLHLNPKKSISLHPDMESIPVAAEFVESALEEANVPMKASMKLQVALDEIYSNIVNYSGASTAGLEVTITPGSIILMLTDNGKPYDPLSRDDPDVTLSAEERNIGGLGIFIVKEIMDEVHYKYEDGLNMLRMVKSLKDEPSVDLSMLDD